MKEILIYDGKIANFVFGTSLNPVDYPGEGDELIVFNPENTSVHAISNKTKSVIELNNSFPFTTYGLYYYPEEMMVKCVDNTKIHLMCPKDTNWVKTEVGAGGDPNVYYMLLKIYAPNKNTMYFKEGTNGAVNDEMLEFIDNPFAGVGDDGRKFSVLWLALAHYDESTNSWIYYGSDSTTEQYIGWDYVVEWYDENGELIGNDAITLNLTNEECH